MKTLESSHTIAALIAHVISKCKPVDREEAFAESLDCEGPVDVRGLSLMPSEIWKECDPTAFRCGVNDYADGMEWKEIEGETYEAADVELAVNEFVDGLNDELADLQTELADALEDEEPIEEDEKRLQDQIDALEKFISECESYSF